MLPQSEMATMLHKCANSECLSAFRRLREGKLFLVETPLQKSESRRVTRRDAAGPHVEYYWLCDRCAFTFTLSYEEGRGVVTVPYIAANKFPAAAVRIGELVGFGTRRHQQLA
jgi:hypothetical protein